MAERLGQPCCSKMTGMTPSKKVLALGATCPYSLRFSCSMRASSLGTLQSGLAMPILTSTQMSVPLGSECECRPCEPARVSRVVGWLSLGMA